MKRLVRLGERDLSRIVRKVIMEQSCSAEDQKPSAGRPQCSEAGVTSGKIISLGELMFLHYRDEANCPKLCSVNQETQVTLS
jgi:hypothetical protein